MSIVNMLPQKPSNEEDCLQVGDILITTETITVGDDFLKSGQSFDKSKYPKFAILFPDGVAPIFTNDDFGINGTLFVYIKAK